MAKKYYEEKRDLEHSVSCTYFNNEKAFVEVHFHKSIEILAIEKGSTIIQVGQEKFVANEGEIVFVPSLFPHSIEKSVCSYYAIIISQPYLNQFNNLYGNAFFGVLTDKNYNQRIFDVLRNFDESNELLLQGQTNTLLGLIVKKYEPITIEGRANNLMTEIIDYLDNNYFEDINLENLSNHFGYSKYYFSRLFNKNFGCNLNVYLNNLRLQKMGKLNTTKSDEILRCGFSSLSTYYRTINKEKMQK